MISSTRADLFQYREEASKIIKKLAAEKEKWVQLVEVSMEKETQSGNREFAVAVSKRWVEEADWVLVIVGFNYGTISDEEAADGLSVTEWEYKHAFKHDKKVFAFIAGAWDTTNPYRASEEETKDLKDWIPQQTEDQKPKIEKFKCELRKPFTELFTNLKNFRERLEQTLRNAIDDLPPNVQPGTPLAEVVVAVQSNIHHCIRKVTLIADCKTIHDHLHELRQKVIRPLREEVLAVWKQEGTLSKSKVSVVRRCVTDEATALGGIRAVRRSIGPDHQYLRDSVDVVLKYPPLWDIESDSPEFWPTRGCFTELVDAFASAVQEAFSEADRSMMTEERKLGEHYHVLLAHLKNAREQRNLDKHDQQRLADELEKSESNRLRVTSFLTHHHSWQEVHDKLEELDSHLDSGQIKRMDQYRRSWLARQLRLVEEELRRTAADQSGSDMVEQSPGLASVREIQSSTKSNGQISNAFVHDLQYLKNSLEDLRQSASVEGFDKMRKPFDSAFYCVDKRTLKEIDRARERVESLDEWLNGLVTAQGKRSRYWGVRDVQDETS